MKGTFFNVYSLYDILSDFFYWRSSYFYIKICANTNNNKTYLNFYDLYYSFY